MSKFWKAIKNAFVFGYTWYKAHPEEAKKIEEAVEKAAKKIIK